MVTNIPARLLPARRMGLGVPSLLCWFFCVGACVVLIGAIPYLPTNYHGTITLFQLFLKTFWGDLSQQVMSLVGLQPRGTLAGEVTQSEWSYCVLVPFIVAWLVWRLWPRLRQTPVHGSSAGYWILAGGLTVYVLGFLIQDYYVGIAAMNAVYAGFIVLFLGWSMMRVLFFAWAFLLFMWPYDFMEDVALQLRLLMSMLSHHALDLIGLENMRQGTAILSYPGAASPFAIDIADPCSGIRSLFALVMIAAIYAFLTLSKLSQQLILVALAIPLVMIGNLVRIVLLALATVHYGESFAVGTDAAPSWFHEAAGYLVYLVNLGGLVLVGWFLGRLSADHASKAAV
jgi:exosortase